MSMIPVNNKPALIGYYLGFAALIPLCGCVPGIAAIVLGFMGLSRAGQLNGEGQVHAIVALVLGFGSVLVYGLLDLLIVVGSIADAAR
jgi:hypothetical protein